MRTNDSDSCGSGRLISSEAKMGSKAIKDLSRAMTYLVDEVLDVHQGRLK